MRAGLCTVSAPLAACSPAAVLPPSARFLALHLLHQQTLYFVVQAKSRVRELYQQTCLHFAQQGMSDTDLFGLALICDGEYLFADLDSKLSKYAPKNWRSSHSHGLDANGRPALAFYFRVQFYVDSPLLLRDETTRHHYYLQLRHNASSGAAGEHAIHLAGLALQADLGDAPDTTGFRPEDYVPPNMRDPAALRAIETAHRSHRGLSKNEARARFIIDACHLQESVNAHVFRLRASKTEPSPGTIMLAVCARGLRVCPDNNPPSIFLWSSIGKLSFERKKFEIRTSHEKLTLYTSSDEKSRLLLNLCKATHQFSMAMAPRLCEARREEEERQKWDCNQRISVISSTSSNTTSGIVSDRVHSEDELEIMITSPPAPSTESLALAHLLDSEPASSRTSAASGIRENSEESINKTSTTNLDGLVRKPVRCTTGSQCSSSCSTVVVTPVQTKVKGRRLSTSSSLELGYSHTAQNSAISETTCIEMENCSETVYTSGPAPSSQTSGVYTLTSSSDQYTLSSSEQQEYGTATESGGDQVDSPFRNRSNSTISNSGSFHGDGSDPTDNQQTLLSAEELTDLIVGRYPSCKSVSHTMDSDSDYVTLPRGYKATTVPSLKTIRKPPPPYGSHLLNKSANTELKKGQIEAHARFITTQSPNVLTAHVSTISLSSTPSYSVPPIPPRTCIERASKKTEILHTLLPPPPPAPRHPPPPPPPPTPLATVYTSQLSRSQIEQYHQQMYSDVDFVVFPLKEPAISKQEYLEVKQGSILAALAQNQPLFYRSAPYLSRYASTQNLSDTYVQLPVYEAPSASSSEPPPPQPPPLPKLGRSTKGQMRFLRTRSDDNILNTIEQQPPTNCGKKRLPPPIPRDENAAPRPKDATANNTRGASSSLDIRTLREKSKKMDLPLISALCNDRSLIKQTKAFVMPKHPGDGTALMSAPISTWDKYPVSGLSTTKLHCKSGKKVPTGSHRHPGDKLPEIPRATPNNYVLTDPRTNTAKHKTIQS